MTSGAFPRRLSTYILPPTSFTSEESDRQMSELTDTSVAQPALGAVEMGLFRLLQRLGVKPDVTGGHSYGEYVALWAAGAFSDETLMMLSVARGGFMKRATAENAGTMAAVGAAPERITSVIGNHAEIWVANLNSPRQTVIAGTVAGIDEAIRLLSAEQIPTRRIAVACAFHSPLVKSAQEQMAALLAHTPVSVPHTTVFANVEAAPYSNRPDQIREVLAEHLVSPVRFREQIEAMYAAGARTFVEVGPKSVLSSLMREILSGREALIVPVSGAGKPELGHLLTTLGQLAVAGVPVVLQSLWQGRGIPQVRVDELRKTVPPAPPAHAWMVNGGRARPLTPRKVAARAPVTAPARPVAAAPTGTVTTRPQPVPDVVVQAPAQVQAAPAAAAPRPPVAAPAAAHSIRGRSVQRQSNPSMGGFMQPHIVPGTERSADQHEVVRQFQQLMSQFLQTQALVMTSYLQGVPQGVAAPVMQSLEPMVPRPELRIAAPPVARPTTGAVAPVTVAATAPLNGTAHHPAVAVQMAAPVVAPPAAAPMPVAAAVAPAPIPAPVPVAKTNGNGRLTEPEVLRELLLIVSDRTGYPPEMLTVDANIESDLGIDSIKRMEILAAFHEAHGGAERGAFQDALERLTALKTLRESASALTEFLAAQAAPAAV